MNYFAVLNHKLSEVMAQEPERKQIVIVIGEVIGTENLSGGQVSFHTHIELFATSSLDEARTYLLQRGRDLFPVNVVCVVPMVFEITRTDLNEILEKEGLKIGEEERTGQ